MASEIQVLPAPPLSSESFVASLPVVPIQELPFDERACIICTVPYRKSTVGFTAINVPSENSVRLTCGHVFGKHCIATWLALETTCPLCRRQFFVRDTSQGSMRRSWHDHMLDPTDLVHNAVVPPDAARGTTVRRPVERRPMPRSSDETTRLRPRVWLRRPAATRMLLAARAQFRNDSSEARQGKRRKGQCQDPEDVSYLCFGTPRSVPEWQRPRPRPYLDKEKRGLPSGKVQCMELKEWKLHRSRRQ